MDNNGFVVISEELEHTGKFFGQIDGTIMDSLVQDRIYKRVTVNDYQGICSNSDNPYTAASCILEPPRALGWLIKYILSMGSVLMSLFPLPSDAWPQDDYAYNDELGDPNYTDDYEPFDEDYIAPIDDEMEELFTTISTVIITFLFSKIAICCCCCCNLF